MAKAGPMPRGEGAVRESQGDGLVCCDLKKGKRAAWIRTEPGMGSRFVVDDKPVFRAELLHVPANGALRDLQFLGKLGGGYVAMIDERQMDVVQAVETDVRLSGFLLFHGQQNGQGVSFRLAHVGMHA
ncbi:MAG TPA: hypothetical protein PKX94_03980, partial [Opitutales bacterium]|nr:hypothetical protein [Opitutales bacterium]